MGGACVRSWGSGYRGLGHLVMELVVFEGGDGVSNHQRLQNC